MLEPVREYAAEQLAVRADAGATADRHGRYYVELAETVAPQLLAADQLAWQRRLDAEADNFQQVLHRAQQAGDFESVVRLATALRDWWRRGRASLGRAWAERGLAGSHELPATLRAHALTTICLLSAQQGDIGHALGCGRRALDLYDEIDDPGGKAIALVGIAVCHLLLGDQPAARIAADEAVRSAHDLGAWPLGYALVARAVAAPDPASAKPFAERAVVLLQHAGDARAQAWLHGDLGYKALEHGALDDAREHIERSMQLAQQLDDQVHYSFDVEHMALWALETGDDGSSAAGLSEALARYYQYGIRRPICEALTALATIAAHAGDPARTAKLLGAAMTLRADEPLTRVEERLNSQAMQVLRHGDDGVSWERAYAAGCRCGLEEAVALGLETASRYSAPLATGPRGPAASAATLLADVDQVRP